MPRTTSRRNLLAGLAGAAGAGALAGCGEGGDSGGGATSGTLKFWDTVWGPTNYITTGKSLVDGYRSASGGFTAEYQSVDWGS